MFKGSLLCVGIVAFAILARNIIGEISVVINLKSAAMVLAGTLIGGLLSVPVTVFHSFMDSLFLSLRRKSPDLNGLILQIVAMARLQRVCDIRELSVRVKALENPFLRMGLQQVLDKRDRRLVEENLEREISLYLGRLQSHLATLNNFTRLAPVFGFVGTIIGLVNILNHLGDATQIGHGMAISLLTTFYGLLLANFLFAPLAGRLAAYIQRETLGLNLIIEGVLAFCDEVAPLEISHRLQAYVETDGDSPVGTAAQPLRFWPRWGDALKQNELSASR